MRRSEVVREGQAGVSLIEALVAIVIFSIAVIGLIGIQATAAKLGTDARYRSEANQLVNQLIGQMWVSDRSVETLRTRFTSGGADYGRWSSAVASMLPGVDVQTPRSTTAPAVSIEGNGQVTVRVFWKPPNEPSSTAPHSLTAIAQIR